MPVDYKLLAKKVHRDAFGLFTWTEDKANPALMFNGVAKDEVWHSFIDKLRLFKRFKGDCDDFALTCADALMDEGVPPESLMLAVCLIAPKQGHAVLIVDDKWLVDNRQETVIPWRRAGYTWIKGMDCSKPGHWFDLSEHNNGG